MKTFIIALILATSSEQLIAAQLCYETTASEDKAIQWMANRDSSKTSTAFTNIVQSAMSQVKSQARRAAENPLQDAYRLCLDNNMKFTITTNPSTGLPVGECK